MFIPKPDNYVEVGSRPYTKHITIVGGYTCQFIITFQDFFPQWLWQSQYRRSALEKYFQTINWEKTRWTVFGHKLHIIPHIVGSIFGPIRFLLPVCRLCWFLYTLNIYAHFSSHFSQQLLMAEIWYLNILKIQL
jgi:hypothetical protein